MSAVRRYDSMGFQSEHGIYVRASDHDAEVERLNRAISDSPIRLTGKQEDPMNAEQVRAKLTARAAAMGSQKALAAEIGVSPAFLSEIITGHREPCGKPVEYLGLERVVEYRKRAQ